MIDPPVQRPSPELSDIVVYVVGDGLETIATSLRQSDCIVTTVDPSVLKNRVAEERPSAVIVNITTKAARESALSLSDAVPGTGTAVVIVAREEDDVDQLQAFVSRVFIQPIDEEVITSHVLSIDSHRGSQTAAPPAPSSPPETIGLFDVEAEQLMMGDLPPVPMLSYPPGQVSRPPDSSSAPPASGWPASVPNPHGPGLLNHAAFAGPTSLSGELEKLLSDAERRVIAEEGSISDVPSPEAEVNAILPPEVLAALDDPLEVSEDEDGSEGSDAHTPVGRGTTGTQGTDEGVRRARPRTDVGESVAPAEPVTADGGEQAATSAVDAQEPTPVPQELEPPRRPTAATVRNPVLSAAYNDAFAFERGGVPFPYERSALPTPVPSDDEYPPRAPTPMTDMGEPPRYEAGLSSRGASGEFSPMSAIPRTTSARQPHHEVDVSQPATPKAPGPRGSGASMPFAGIPREVSEQVAGPGIPEVLSPDHDGLRVLGACIAARVSATLCFEQDGALCRAVMRDGDFVTCGSSADDESLLAFLMLRGDMPREIGMQMVGRMPPFGRHAAAALIANGFLGQDQLWVVLRAHAEWLLGRMASSQHGTCALEPEPPGRLKAEPAVFGGATGAEVLVEVAQRVLPLEDAIDRLGGPLTRLSPGINEALLAECALSVREREVVERSSGSMVRDVLAAVGQPEFAAVLVALHELGVVDLIAAIGGGQRAPIASAHDPLDAEAVRKRIDARLAVIQEGDYFEVIGVPRTATGYEIRRAYLEARRAYEPAKLLTAETADLLDDVRLIVEVLDEAYELLRDEARRDRYRRALEAMPPQM